MLKNAQIAELFAIAKETQLYSVSKSNLLRTVTQDSSTNISGSKITTNYRVNNYNEENETYQNKLHHPYGL
jgi:hypothetical protein